MASTHALASMPACPVTGDPAVRCLQSIGVQALQRVWRAAGAGDLSHLFAKVERLGLYESRVGLFFFHPVIAGDELFYARFYASIGGHDLINKRLPLRVEYRHAAALIPAGATVLDVGCGMGGFKAHLPHAEYRGLDPYAPPTAPSQILRE